MEIGDKITVVVPHRISGFFQIVESGGCRPVDDIAKVGSRGGGPSLTAYGKTTVEIIDILNGDSVSVCEIYINGKKATKSAKTTFYVFSHMASMIKQPVKVRITHKFRLPIGCGYGASGCGAIGTAFGLNFVLGLGLSYNTAGKIAHIGEVMNKTGLGTVGGQLFGGLSITTRAGYPFELDRIFVPPETKIVCGSFGPIPTSSIIGDPEHKEVIKAAGAWAMDELMRFPTFENFIRISRTFVDKIRLLSMEGMRETAELIERLNRLGNGIYGASMNQLGKSVYCFCKKEAVKKVLEIFETYESLIFLDVLEVCDSGPRLVASD